ncbi:YadA-like family protein [Mesorhizobium sp. M0924]|uniref:YadA-like family protein n=1 Tax=unclassified Mesorhizobium TaxID=325217 RepID=UPI00333D7BDE
MTKRVEGRRRIELSSSFVGNWIAGAADSRSVRRRLMAVLRMAHRVLGFGRKNMGLGTLGSGTSVRSALACGVSPASMLGGLAALAALGLATPAQAQYQAGGGSATGGNAVAIGNGAATNGNNSVALGSSNSATGDGTIAIGYAMGVNGLNSIGIGVFAGATGVNALAVGGNAKANGDAASAIGVNSVATTSAAAFGNNARADGVNSTAIGPVTRATGLRATALGFGATASGVDSIAQGNSAVASNQNAVAIGFQSTATAINSVYLGSRTAAGTGALAQGAVGIGTDVTASQVDAIAMGRSSVSSAQYAVAIGLNAKATGAGGAMALGQGTISSGVNSVALGVQANATGAGSNALGTLSVASGGNATALGTSSTASNNYATAVGWGTVASGTNSFAGGQRAAASGASSTALGTTSNASGDFALALGNGAVSSGTGSVATGSGAQATAVATVAIGNNAAATAQNAIAAGTGAVANSADAVAVGTNATATGGKAVAIGAGNTAYGNGAVSIGDPSYASGTGAFTGGANNIANSDGTATATAANQAAGAVAIGNNNKAVGQGSVALGNGSTAGAAGLAGNVALGNGATATASSGDVALGSGSVTATAVGTSGATIGGTAYSFAGTTPTSTVSVGALGAERTITNVAAGRLSNSSTDAINGSQLFATNQQVTQNTTAIAANTADITNLGNTINSISTGGGIKYFHANSTAADSSATGTDSVAIGPVATATGTNAIAAGTNSSASDANASAFGSGAVASALDATAMGYISKASGQYSTAVGANANATATSSTAIGQNAFATAFQATALGVGANAGAQNAIALGALANASNAGDVALGSGSVTAAAVGTAGTTIGGVAYNFAGTTPASTVSVGAVGAERTITNVAAGRLSNSSTDAINGSQLFATNQQVTQNTTDIAANTADITNLGNTINSISTGGGIKYFHANSTLADSQALGTDSVAIGPNAVANNAGDVAIGANAVSTVTTAVGGTTIGGVAYTFAGTTPAGAFSVGSVGAERQIQNVAAGQLSGSSTDAVNGSQLFATNQQVTQNTTDIAANTADITNLGNSISNITGDTSLAYTDANGDGIRYVRTNDRTLAVADSFAQGIGSSALGYQATASADNALALGRDTQASVIGGVALGAGSVSDRAVAPVSGSILSGTGLIPYNTADMSLLGAVSVGTSTSYRQIINVADGTQDQDAVTLRQLKGALSSFAVTGSLYFHANSTAADSLAVGVDSVAVGPRTTVNGDNGIGIGNGAIVQQTAPGGIAIGQNSTVNQADSIALGTNATTNGAQAVALGAGAKANEPGSVALGAGSTTAAAVATTGTTINGVAYTFAGTAPTSTVSVGTVGNERTVTNVAAGRISGTSTDAINGSQLFATNQAVEAMQGSVGDLNQFAVQYDKDGNGNKSNSITLAGGDPNTPVVIHNVGPGVANTDAVNVQQFNSGLALNLDNSKNYTNQVAATTLQQANAYADSKLSQLNMDMGEVRGEARQAAAIGLAAGSLRYDDRPGKLSVAAGGGYWRGEGALAFGAGYTSEEGRVRANLSGTTAGGHWGVGAGVSLTLN